jgi:hypothetical protein
VRAPGEYEIQPTGSAHPTMNASVMICAQLTAAALERKEGRPKDTNASGATGRHDSSVATAAKVAKNVSQTPPAGRGYASSAFGAVSRRIRSDHIFLDCCNHGIRQNLAHAEISHFRRCRELSNAAVRERQINRPPCAFAVHLKLPTGSLAADLRRVIWNVVVPSVAVQNVSFPQTDAELGACDLKGP